MIQLAAIDLDGTLLRDDMTISTASREILQKAARQVRIVVATGRMFDSAREKANLLGLPDMPVICYTGALVGMTVSGRILWEEGLPLSLAEEILAEGRRQGWSIQSYIHDNICMPGPSPAEAKYRKYRAKPAQYLGEAFYHPAFPPTRLIVTEPNEEKRAAIRAAVAARFGNEVDMVYPGDDFLDIHKKGVSKAAALLRLSEGWGIAPKEMVSFGNTENDASMLKMTGLSYAVANAEPAAKEAARDILPDTNNEDAVAKKLSSLLGL